MYDDPSVGAPKRSPEEATVDELSKVLAHQLEQSESLIHNAESSIGQAQHTISVHRSVSKACRIGLEQLHGSPDQCAPPTPGY